MELVDYTDDDLALSVALETDPVVMAELGGPRSLESIEKVHPRRVAPSADGGMWLKIVLEDEPEPVGAIGVWWSEWQDEELWEVGWMLRPQFHGRGSRQRGARDADRAPARGRRSSTWCTPSRAPPTRRRTGSAASSASSSLDGGEVEFAGRPLTVNHWVAANGRLSSGRGGRRVLAGLVGDQPRLLGLALAAAQHPQPEDRRREQAGRPEAELDAQQALARPVDVVELEQQRRLVEGEPDPGAERQGEGLLELARSA